MFEELHQGDIAIFCYKAKIEFLQLVWIDLRSDRTLALAIIGIGALDHVFCGQKPAFGIYHRATAFAGNRATHSAYDIDR
ncbi:hypothetical protein CSE45_0239 [Citreicella sp. SE45]|nr:hypothetical protein CSE45_0239 [Citreicella sp. SE45]